ncbi:phosphoheptose isomerase [Verrucomicrobia bacterium LW23]|nr:phosphoheptose isomerase [Verrucomicrobia bacterium LW23]
MHSTSIVETQYRQLVEAVDALKSEIPVIARAADLIIHALEAGGKVLTAGNGGSAAEAMHMSEELVGRFRTNRRSLPALCLAADASAITCIANDFGYERVFSRQIEGLGEAGDVLVLFTTSGNSPNMVRAAEAAKERGLKVVAFLGRDGGKLKGMADVEWIPPTPHGPRVQELHNWAMHCIMEIAEARFS